MYRSTESLGPVPILWHRLKIDVSLIRDETPLWVAHEQISARRASIGPHHGVYVVDLGLWTFFSSYQRSTARNRCRCRVEEMTTEAHNHRLALDATRIDLVHLSHDRESLLDL